MTIPVIHKLDPAYAVIEKLGGKRAVADELEIDKSTLTRWCKPAPDGTGGVIPQRYWPQLIAMARKQGVTINVMELVAVEV
jgi:hypothetical protein